MRKRTWILFSAVCFAVAAALWTWGVSHRNETAFAAQVGGVEEASEQKYIALTFDDGPKAGRTDLLLDGLAQRGVKATFFLIGQMVEGSEDLVRRMEEEGHQVGLHTYHHVDVKGLSQEAFAEEMALSRGAVENVLGAKNYMLRPPYGFYNDNIKAWAGTPIILWSVDTLDWKYQNADRLAAVLTQETKDGDIVLMHDIFSSSVEGVLRGVDALLEQGYTLVTVDELFAIRGIQPEPGHVYSKLAP